MQDPLSESLLDLWSKRVGPLPPGFWLDVVDHSLLCLNYDGPGFENVVEPGGDTPDSGDTHALVTCILIKGKMTKMVNFIRSWVKITQDKLCVKA